MTFRDVTSVSAPTFAVARTADRSPADVDDRVTVEIDTDKPRPIQIVTENGNMFFAASASQAYGIGAHLSPADARRLAAALTEAADELDPRPPSGGAFSISLGG
ncbi:hypothetical protein [Rhodococcus sp. IEGM 1330]|uniref:hypothetical protein n=1 Tax=Rhodococcus sp. IEGM 1330 TaxID=3082225 RepID=UPI0029557A24|nr:hypothetical protein [Rhodococcus sp. IEGM 1330]MDV8023393.1 hypothetical protein [Rhodococcus sp. IEGM 1330]